MDVREAVEQVNMLSGLEPPHVEQLAAISVLRRYERGEIIFSEGGEAGGLYAVATGLVRIYKTSFSGKEQILHVFGPGEAFAEVAVFKGMSLPANAQALEPSDILFVPKAGLLSLIRSDPDVALDMLALLSMRLRAFVAKIEELSLKEVPARLAAHVLLLHASQGGDRVRLDLPKGQLAALLGTIPETFSRVLKKLDSAGILRVEGHELHILDLTALERVALGEKV